MQQLFLKLIIFILLFLSASGFAQKTVIRIVSEKSTDPCSFANVVLYDQNNNYIKGSIAGSDGTIQIDIKEKTKFAVSLLGYQNYTDYISPGEEKTVNLKLSYIGINEVVVTGQYTPQPVDKSIYKINLISSRQIEERGVNNLAEALSNETNIRLSVDPALGTSLKLQGMSGENVKFLIDGIPVIGRLGGNIDLTQINLDNVDHIEIVQGPMSVVYGTNALAGVVNIITKENTQNDNILNFTSYTGTEGAYNFSLSGSVIRNKHTVSLYGSRKMFQGIDLTDSTRSVEFKPKLQYNADFDYVYRNKDLKIKFKSSFFDEEIRHYGTIQGISVTDMYFFTNRFTNSLQFINRFSESFSFDFLGSHSYYDRQTRDFRKDLTNFEVREIGDISQTEYSNIMARGNFLIEKPNSKFIYQFGFDINIDEAKGDKISNGAASMEDYALYLSSQYNIIKNLSVQPGLRFIYNSKYGAPVVPSINLLWNFFDVLSLRTSYARGFRSPSIKELYFDFVDINHDLHGNPDLLAETNNSYNTSITYNFEKEKYLIKIEPSFFFNDGKNVIDLVNLDPSSNRYKNVNVGRRRTIGGELSTTFLFYPNITLNAGYSRTGVTYSASTDASKLPDYTFYNDYSINTKYNLRKRKLIFSVYLKYYGKTPSLFYREGVYFLINKNSYGELEVSITKTVWKDRISAVIGGKNLLNNKYIGYENGSLSSSPTAYGRYYFIKLNIKLNTI